MKNIRQLGIATLTLLALSLPSLAAVETAVVKHSPKHTEITIHDHSPEAYLARREQSQRAQERLEKRRQRKHQLELEQLRLKAELEKARVERMATPKVNPTPTKYDHHKKASFKNGGRFTGFGPTLGNRGFGYGYGRSYGNYGYGGFYGYGYGNTGIFKRNSFRTGFSRRL